MRILHTIHSANPRGGGPIEGVTQLSLRIMRSGHEVELLTLDDPGAPWIQRLPITCHAVGRNTSSYGYTPRLEPWLQKHHRRFDVVIINGIWQYSSYGVWRALRKTATPYVVFPHGMLDPWFKRRYPLKHIKKWLYWSSAEFRVLRDAAAVIFTSEDERLLSRQSFWPYHCHECVMTYGTSPPGGDAGNQRRRFIDAFPRLEAKRLLLFLGRIHEKKGCDLLLKAFAAILADSGKREELPLRDIHLVICGPDDNTYAAGLKLLVRQLGLADRVTWTGMLSGDVKWGAFRAAEAFVLPSHQENFGIAVAEALAAGVPVLISNRVNIWREIETHNAGLVESDDLAGTVALLKRWMQTPVEQKARMKANALQCFNRCFDIEHIADSFIAILHRLGLRGAAAPAPLCAEVDPA